jgi:XTP/dITP diphosphohydrolase
MEIVFATNNAHKLSEIRAILGDSIKVLSLSDIGCEADIPETGTTLEENALQKANYVWQRYHLPCFADDTGLEVEALNGEPGIYSARYAEKEEPAAKSHDSEANMRVLLGKLGDQDNRKARFRTVIALIEPANGQTDSANGQTAEGQTTAAVQIRQFEGIVTGQITRRRSGVGGFGYDPIFQPDGYDQTFAELGSEVKNQISHRARATQKLCEYLTKNKTLAV